jgi:CHAT domain-containing protein
MFGRKYHNPEYFDSKQSSYLMFPEGGYCGVSISEVAELLKRHHVRHVALNACLSSYAHLGDINNMTHTLIRQGVSSVSAMSYRIRPETAQTYYRTFYQALILGGQTFSAAAASGRAAVLQSMKRVSPTNPEQIVMFQHVTGIKYRPPSISASRKKHAVRTSKKSNVSAEGNTQLVGSKEEAPVIMADWLHPTSFRDGISSSYGTFRPQGPWIALCIVLGKQLWAPIAVLMLYWHLRIVLVASHHDAKDIPVSKSQGVLGLLTQGFHFLVVACVFTIITVMEPSAHWSLLQTARYIRYLCDCAVTTSNHCTRFKRFTEKLKPVGQEGKFSLTIDHMVIEDLAHERGYLYVELENNNYGRDVMQNLAKLWLRTGFIESATFTDPEKILRQATGTTCSSRVHGVQRPRLLVVEKMNLLKDNQHGNEKTSSGLRIEKLLDWIRKEREKKSTYVVMTGESQFETLADRICKHSKVLGKFWADEVGVFWLKSPTTYLT